MKWPVWFLVVWCLLVLAVGPDVASVGYIYSGPALTLLFHLQLRKWERDHKQTLWWRTGLVGRREYFFAA